ncbi:hypothetical protein IHE44_0011558 [Lamprotornis superbus]|uniref:Peptidase S1 domain-containing protein n=1 Tax=Lamprotornis superbus TaxID=245042 RepID=A0A835NKU6_9PASS|nr:hypothetical protein IHE44_0011558 [Lamprotornis superbus]
MTAELGSVCRPGFGVVTHMPKASRIDKGTPPGDTRTLLTLEEIYWRAIQIAGRTSSTEWVWRRDDSKGGCFSPSATEGAGYYPESPWNKGIFGSVSIGEGASFLVEEIRIFGSHMKGAMTWCSWQSKVLVTGGGMKDGILCVWHMNCEKIIQSAITDLQDSVEPNILLHLDLGRRKNGWQANIPKGCMDIVGGYEVYPHSRPYMAAMRDKNLGVFCGGTLVEKQWVLRGLNTAKLNKYMQLLPLSDSFEDVEPGTLCQVAGWLGRHITRKSGDSGGLLICAGQYCGIVSFGKECENTIIPGVSTWLTEKYIDWMKRTISNVLEHLKRM